MNRALCVGYAGVTVPISAFRNFLLLHILVMKINFFLFKLRSPTQLTVYFVLWFSKITSHCMLSILFHITF